MCSYVAPPGRRRVPPGPGRPRPPSTPPPHSPGGVAAAEPAASATGSVGTVSQQRRTTPAVQAITDLYYYITENFNQIMKITIVHVLDSMISTQVVSQSQTGYKYKMFSFLLCILIKYFI